MSAEPSNKKRCFPWLLFAVVGFALLFNGLFWAVRFPPLHPNDEPQHYLYAAQFDGVEPRSEPGVYDVPRDLQVYGELAGFGPHFRARQVIGLTDDRADEIAAMTAETDDTDLAAVYVPDSEADHLVCHADFNSYHPPTYYFALGQVMGLGHKAGLGVRGRLLLGRLFSVVLGLIAVGLAVLLARVIWPGQWTLPVLVGMGTGLQVLVAFYTSVLNNEVLAYLFFTAFLAMGARVIIAKRPSLLSVLVLVGVGLLAVATKITMVALFPMGLIAFALSAAQRWMRVACLTGLILFMVVALAWLLIPLGGGETVTDEYVNVQTQPRSFPAEMFTPDRLWDHGKMVGRYWGRQVGNSIKSDTQIPAKFYYSFAALAVLSTLMGMLTLTRLSSERRRVMLWLLLAPLMLGGLLYAIDYRFASMGGTDGMFLVRPQYYIPAAAAQMTWMVWGLTSWLRGKARIAVVAGLAALMGSYNVWVLFWLISPRYYGHVGWWAQCEQIAMLWPVPAWSVAMVDGLAMASVAAAVAVLTAFSRSEAKQKPF